MEENAYIVALDRIENAIHSCQALSDYTIDEMQLAHRDVTEAIAKLRAAKWSQRESNPQTTPASTV